MILPMEVRQIHTTIYWVCGHVTAHDHTKGEVTPRACPICHESGVKEAQITEEYKS